MNMERKMVGITRKDRITNKGMKEDNWAQDTAQHVKEIVAGLKPDCQQT